MLSRDQISRSNLVHTLAQRNDSCDNTETKLLFGKATGRFLSTLSTTGVLILTPPFINTPSLFSRDSEKYFKKTLAFFLREAENFGHFEQIY